MGVWIKCSSRVLYKMDADAVELVDWDMLTNTIVGNLGANVVELVD